MQLGFLQFTIKHVPLLLFMLQLLPGAVLITTHYFAGVTRTNNRKLFQCNEKWNSLLYIGD